MTVLGIGVLLPIAIRRIPSNRTIKRSFTMRLARLTKSILATDEGVLAIAAVN